MEWLYLCISVIAKKLLWLVLLLLVSSLQWVMLQSGERAKVFLLIYE